MKTISVIIPAFNCGHENALKRCVESILNSSYTYLQIIIMDDGSTDETWEVCQELTKLYPNIECYHQDNMGCSEARANALKYVQGEYLAFVDADDTVDQDYFMYLVNLYESEQADMVSTQFYDFYSLDEQKKEKDIFYKVIDRKEAIKIYPEDGTLLNWNLCGKLLNAKLFCENHRATGLKMASDSLEIFEYVLRCNKVVISNAQKYNYYHLNEGSITKSSFSIKKLDLLRFYIIMADKYNRMQDYPENVAIWRRRAYDYAMSSIVSCYLSRIPNYKKIARKLSGYLRKNYNDVILLTGESKVKLFAICIFPHIFGTYARIRNR